MRPSSRQSRKLAHRYEAVYAGQYIVRAQMTPRELGNNVGEALCDEGMLCTDGQRHPPLARTAGIQRTSLKRSQNTDDPTNAREILARPPDTVEGRARFTRPSSSGAVAFWTPKTCERSGSTQESARKTPRNPLSDTTLSRPQNTTHNPGF